MASAMLPGVYVQYSYDFEKQRAAQVWEFILDQIVTCESPKDIPTLEEIRYRVKSADYIMTIIIGIR